jgi:hypothetical protein
MPDAWPNAICDPSQAAVAVAQMTAANALPAAH